MTPTDDRRSGGCLCGAVRFTARVPKTEADACHCSMCRRSSGGIAMQVEAAELSFEDEGNVGVYRSSDWAERLFCPSCGSNLVWRMQDGSFTTVSAYAFDPPFDPPLRIEIFVDEKPEGYAFAGDTSKLTGAEVAALFARPSE